jgi:hypothetical protein
MTRNTLDKVGRHLGCAPSPHPLHGTCVLHQGVYSCENHGNCRCCHGVLASIYITVSEKKVCNRGCLCRPNMAAMNRGSMTCKALSKLVRMEATAGQGHKGALLNWSRRMLPATIQCLVRPCRPAEGLSDRGAAAVFLDEAVIQPWRCTSRAGDCAGGVAHQQLSCLSFQGIGTAKHWWQQ